MSCQTCGDTGLRPVGGFEDIGVRSMVCDCDASEPHRAARGLISVATLGLWKSGYAASAEPLTMERLHAALERDAERYGRGREWSATFVSDD